MFRDIRRKDREATNEDALRILDEGEYGVLGTVGPDGYPYTTPLSYVYHNGNIYFHCAVEGHKLDNISYNSNVSFCVTGKTKVLPEKFSTIYESTVVFGHAEKVQGTEKQKALEAIVEKYSRSFKREGLEYINKAADKTCVIRIHIDRMTAKARKQ